MLGEGEEGGREGGREGEREGGRETAREGGKNTKKSIDGTEHNFSFSNISLLH